MEDRAQMKAAGSGKPAGHAAIVTGAGRDPGLAVARRLSAEGGPRDHLSVQPGRVGSGRVRIRLGGEEHEAACGVRFGIPSGLRQGCVRVEAGTLVDGLAPRREDVP